MARFLYIVSRRESEQSGQIFVCLKRDLLTAAVQLSYDRRFGERRDKVECVNPDRRQGDRRRCSVEVELAQVGWARVQIE